MCCKNDIIDDSIYEMHCVSFWKVGKKKERKKKGSGKFVTLFEFISICVYAGKKIHAVIIFCSLYATTQLLTLFYVSSMKINRNGIYTRI